MNNDKLCNAKTNINDEFYTQYSCIETEMNEHYEYNNNVFRNKTILMPCDDPEWSNFTKYFVANFEKFGIKKLISTSYAYGVGNLTETEFEKKSPKFDKTLNKDHGKIFIMERDEDGNKKDFEFVGYLNGDGDFRSDEVTKLRDEADIIITNPPFSLFRDFTKWLLDVDKKFIIIGSFNAITYKEFFPYIRDNKVWSGNKSFSGGMDMIQPKSNFDETKTKSYKINEKGEIIKNVNGVVWFTNIETRKRNAPLQLMTQKENLKFNKKLIALFEKNDMKTYMKYENYDVLEVPLVDAIPDDYDGVIGVPITFIDKYCPEQFEIIGMAEDNGKGYSGKEAKWDGKNPHCVINGKNFFKRIFIKKRREK